MKNHPCCCAKFLRSTVAHHWAAKHTQLSKNERLPLTESKITKNLSNQRQRTPDVQRQVKVVTHATFLANKLSWGPYMPQRYRWAFQTIAVGTGKAYIAILLMKRCTTMQFRQRNTTASRSFLTSPREFLRGGLPPPALPNAADFRLPSNSS